MASRKQNYHELLLLLLLFNDFHSYSHPIEENYYEILNMGFGGGGHIFGHECVVSICLNDWNLCCFGVHSNELVSFISPLMLRAIQCTTTNGSKHNPIYKNVLQCIKTILFLFKLLKVVAKCFFI